MGNCLVDSHYSGIIGRCGLDGESQSLSQSLPVSLCFLAARRTAAFLWWCLRHGTGAHYRPRNRSQATMEPFLWKLSIPERLMSCIWPQRLERLTAPRVLLESWWNKGPQMKQESNSCLYSLHWDHGTFLVLRNTLKWLGIKGSHVCKRFREKSYMYVCMYMLFFQLFL